MTNTLGVDTTPCLDFEKIKNESVNCQFAHVEIFDGFMATGRHLHPWRVSGQQTKGWDLAENLCRKVGDDRQRDCYASCDNTDNIDVDIAKMYSGMIMKRNTAIV